MKYTEISFILRLLVIILLFLASILVRDSAWSQLLASFCILMGITMFRTDLSHLKRQDSYEEAN